MLLPSALATLALPSALAGDASWKAAPSNGIWNRAANWDPATVPSHPRDAATFGTSSQTALSLRSSISLGTAIFDVGGSAYNITVGPGLSLDFMRNGVTNNAAILQNFVSTTDASGHFGLISFSRRAKAGDLCTFTTEPGMLNGGSGGMIQFNNFAKAGSSTFVNNGALISGGRGGETDFFDNTSADTGTFTAKAGTAFSTAGGTIAFFGSSTAATAEFTAEGGSVPAGFGGEIYLRENSTASDAKITLNGGSADLSTGANMYIEETASLGQSFIYVYGGETAGTSNGAALNLLGSSHPGGSQIFAFDGAEEDAQPGTMYFYDDSNAEGAILRLFHGVLDISPHNPGTVILGNILGYYGDVYLGSNNLEIGGNNILSILEVAFHDDGIAGGSGGSITKTGTNVLTLLVASDFTGGITAKQGRLSFSSPTGSASGTGPVVVSGGVLEGRYTIDGPITVNARSSLLPWGDAMGNYYGNFETKSTVAFAAGSVYKWDLKGNPMELDLLIADGVTIDGATFVPVFSGGSQKLEAGLELIAISNTSANPIAGAFNGLPEGSVIALGKANTAQVSYTGGDGNDFTLTVLP